MRTLTANDLLLTAASILESRAEEYDVDEERSMKKVIDIFNIFTENNLTEYEGWLFMQILKDVRALTPMKPHKDSLIDCIAYAALKAEAREQ